MKNECSDTKETQQTCLPLDQGTGSEERFVEQTIGRELNCQNRQSITNVTSAFEYANMIHSVPGHSQVSLFPTHSKNCTMGSW